jgi:amidase
MALHHFQPTHYHIAIGSSEPVLRIGDGDTVVTTTVDAFGKDSSDTLLVQLDQIVPNRAIGYSGSVVAPNVVEPSYVRELPERELAEWRVDNECGTATLVKPETKLGNLAIPLAAR